MSREGEIKIIHSENLEGREVLRVIQEDKTVLSQWIGA